MGCLENNERNNKTYDSIIHFLMDANEVKIYVQIVFRLSIY